MTQFRHVLFIHAFALLTKMISLADGETVCYYAAVTFDNLVSIFRGNLNFSRIARLVDEKGITIILKNNAPRYVLLDYSLLCPNTVADDVEADGVAVRILDKHKSV